MLLFATFVMRNVSFWSFELPWTKLLMTLQCFWWQLGCSFNSLKVEQSEQGTKSCKSSFKGNLKVGFQLLFLSSYFHKGGLSYKKDTKGRCHLLFNLLLLLEIQTVGIWYLPMIYFCLILFPYPFHCVFHLLFISNWLLYLPNSTSNG